MQSRTHVYLILQREKKPLGKIAEARRVIQKHEEDLDCRKYNTILKQIYFDIAVRQYAVAYCRRFFSKFQKAFVHELRAMVYEELCLGHHLSTSVAENSPREPGHIDIYVRRWSYFHHDNQDLPHYFSPEFSGGVARELAEHVYRTKHYHVDSLGLLDKFLDFDYFNVGVLPGDVIQHLHVKVCPEEGKPHPRETSLQVLEKIKSRAARVEIALVSGICVCMPNHPIYLRQPHPLKPAIDFMEHVGPSIYEFQDLGFRFTVSLKLSIGTTSGYATSLPSKHIHTHTRQWKLPETLTEFLEKSIPEYRTFDERCHALVVKHGDGDAAFRCWHMDVCNLLRQV